MKEQILELREEGKSYNEICEIIGCSKSVVSYHCGAGQKEKSRVRRKKNCGTHLVCHKIEKFCRRKLQTKSDDFQRERVFRKGKGRTGLGKHFDKTFGYKDVVDKFGMETICYLTGRQIDLTKPRTYNFDHIVPVSKGGKNTIENLGIACREANLAKSDMMPEEFIQLCREVLEHNGFSVADLRKRSEVGEEPVSKTADPS